MIDRTPIYVGARVVGEVRGDTFHKRISASKHFLQRPPAIAFDLSTLHDAQRAGAVYVQVLDTDTPRTYAQTIDTIFQRGFQFNRGHGEQIALPLSVWVNDVRAIEAQRQSERVLEDDAPIVQPRLL